MQKIKIKTLYIKTSLVHGQTDKKINSLFFSIIWLHLSDYKIMPSHCLKKTRRNKQGKNCR